MKNELILQGYLEIPERLSPFVAAEEFKPWLTSTNGGDFSFFQGQLHEQLRGIIDPPSPKRILSCHTAVIWNFVTDHRDAKTVLDLLSEIGQWPILISDVFSIMKSSESDWNYEGVPEDVLEANRCYNQVLGSDWHKKVQHLAFVESPRDGILPMRFKFCPVEKGWTLSADFDIESDREFETDTRIFSFKT